MFQRRLLIVFFHSFIFGASAVSQTSEKMTNADITALCSAGISDDLVIAKIRAARVTEFDTSIEGLKALQANHVPQSVIAEMISPRGAVTPVSEQGHSAPGYSHSDDPAEIHAPGVYIYAQTGSGPRLILLKRIVAKEVRHTGGFTRAVTHGIVASKNRMVLEGEHAPVKTSDTHPSFYLYAPPQEAQFGGTYLVPNSFTLVRFEPRNNTRELVEGSFGLFTAKSGIDDKAKQGFTAAETKPGIHKIELSHPLSPGEYAFAYNRAVFYDFSILNEK